jgi:hypothetical protein
MTDSIEQLLNDNKHRFVVDKAVLDKRVKYTIDTYDLVKPTLNLEQNLHARVGKHYRNLHELLIDSADFLNRGYILDQKLTKPCSKKLNVYFIKPDDIQSKEKTALKKKVKALYLEELEKAKKQWLIQVTEQVAKNTEIEALEKVAISNRTLQEQLLAMMQ